MPKYSKGRLTAKVVWAVFVFSICAEIATRLVTYGIWRKGLSDFPSVARRLEETKRNMPRLDWRPIFRYLRDSDASNIPAPIMKTSDGPARLARLTTFGRLGPDAFSKPPRDDSKKNRLIRVAFFGGSTTFDGYPDIVQEMIDDYFGANLFEVLNLGVPASSSPTTLVLMKRFVPRWKPRLIVIYHGFNDIVFYDRLLTARGLEPGQEPDEALIPRIKASRGLLDLFRHKFLYKPIFFDEGESFVVRSIKNTYSDMDRFVRAQKAKLFISTFDAPDYDRLSDKDRRFYEAHLTYLWPLMGNTTQYARSIAQYNRLVREVAAEREIELIEIAEKTRGGRDMFRDNCHRTNEGKKEHARLVFEALKKSLFALKQSASR